MSHIPSLRTTGSVFFPVEGFSSEARGRLGHAAQRSAGTTLQGEETLTCCLCGPAAVAATSSVPDHQLSSVHHGFERLPENRTNCQSRKPVAKTSSLNRTVRVGTGDEPRTRSASLCGAAWPRKQRRGRRGPRCWRWPSPRTTSARRRPEGSTYLKEG